MHTGFKYYGVFLKCKVMFGTTKLSERALLPMKCINNQARLRLTDSIYSIAYVYNKQLLTGHH